MDNFSDKVAIITGAASGIGRATAISLAREGTYIVAADINAAGVSDVVSELGKDKAIAVQCDIGDTNAFSQLRDAALKQFGRVDIIMNNAGILTSCLPLETTIEEWQRVFDLNFMSIVRSNAVFLPLLIDQGAGHIVNTASFAGLYTYSFDRLPYAAAKAGLIQYSEGLALYLKPQGIGVTCLCPGPVKTNIVNSVKQFPEGLDVRGPGEQFELLDPAVVGDQVVDAIQNDIFMLVTHPQVKPLLVHRATDWDGFLQQQIDSPHIALTAEMLKNMNQGT